MFHAQKLETQTNMLLYPAHSGTHDSSELVFADFFSTKKQDREKEKLRNAQQERATL